MTPVGWEDTKRRVRERREAAGLPVRSEEQKKADMDRLAAEVRAHRLAEIRQEQTGADFGDTDYTLT
ncbi:hypothetical protein [Microbispora hainanensis]|uniref:Uncharacterized protein n=1 Tax=Microbispora hainanensis TaxID=568844 RepID=A0A544YVF8_9ACTN|nr:hypothetical protein [Microbispora hainanensis]TQS20748.1 hypothetical protein FLX08_14815 [Microbispora hainanensis]